MSTSRQTVNTPDAPDTKGLYSHGVKAGGLLFISGQVPLDPATGQLVEGTIGEQTRRVLDNLAAIAAAAGATLATDAVKLTCYLADIADWPAMNVVYSEVFTTDPPARAAFQVAALPMGARVEIEAVVAVD